MRSPPSAGPAFAIDVLRRARKEQAERRCSSVRRGSMKTWWPTAATGDRSNRRNSPERFTGWPVTVCACTICAMPSVVRCWWRASIPRSRPRRWATAASRSRWTPTNTSCRRWGHRSLRRSRPPWGHHQGREWLGLRERLKAHASDPSAFIRCVARLPRPALRNASGSGSTLVGNLGWSFLVAVHEGRGHDDDSQDDRSRDNGDVPVHERPSAWRWIALLPESAIASLSLASGSKSGSKPSARRSRMTRR